MKLSKLFDLIKSPLSVGILLTLIFVYLSTVFYSKRGQNDTERKPNLAYTIADLIDLNSLDLRFILRGQRPPPENLALLALDDRSVEEIGRWPWSREKIAFVLEEIFKHGAKAVGMDIVFAEPQNEKSADQILAKTFSKYQDKIVLGAFGDERVLTYAPYQDYCRNEAFKRANADLFVKLNPTFIVDDADDQFVDMDFDAIFSLIFQVIEKKTKQATLQEDFSNKSENELLPHQKNRLKYLLQAANHQYCYRWLTDDDPFKDQLKNEYLKIFSQSEPLKGLEFSVAVQKFKSSVKSHPIPQKTRWTVNTELLQHHANYTGTFNAEQDADGTIRKASMFYRTGNKIGTSFVPSLPLQTFLLATGLQARIEINRDPRNQEQKILTKFDIVDPNQDPEILYAHVPTDGQGRIQLNYYGGKQMFPHLPAKELFNGKNTVTIERQTYDSTSKEWHTKTEVVEKASFIKDKIFIFGATAIGIYDLRVTPFEKNFPGPETHVNTIANLMQKNFLKAFNNEHQFMPWILLVLGLLFSWAIGHMGAIMGFGLTFITLALLAIIDQILFTQGYILTTVLPFFLLLGLYIFLTFYKYFTEERKKRFLRATFSKYVSPAIVDEILKDPENIELGGRKQRMTVFFSDVRGFTTISEKLDPQLLSDVLNRYLTPMTQVVFNNKGTLDKYMGDAVMAFFGAPVVFPDHAKYACRCALQSISKLNEIRKEFQAQGLPDIDIGIGINTSEMSVGNMGSDIVRNYTVMGDAVNLGSRLEGINREYGTRIIISEYTYEDVKDQFVTREIDKVRVKGKNQPVKIYELIAEGPISQQLQSHLTHFASGYQLYQQKKFAEAMSEFTIALNDKPDDPVCALYIERSRNYIEQPPPDNWDGVFVMKTK